MSDDRISNYPGNSHKDKSKDEAPQDRKVERVTTAEAVQRKKPLGRKIAETFTGDDMRSVGMYILLDVLVPAAKSMLSDAASQGVERLLFGDSSSSSSRPRQGGATGRVSYNRMHSSDRSRLNGPRTISSRARATHDFDEIVLKSRVEAEVVIDRLSDLIDNYDFATVSDLYELVGITGSFVDDKWGWNDLRGSEVRRVRDGYLLVLPKTIPSD